jgi:hypothetical protein
MFHFTSTVVNPACSFVDLLGERKLTMALLGVTITL